MALKSGRVGIHPSLVDPITGMLLVNPSGASDLSDLGDVDISNPEVGQTLIYNGNKWENEYSSISPTTPNKLATLQDVALNDLANGQILEYNATSEKWENVFASISPVTPATLASLQDVRLSSISNDQILRYNSTDSKWENEDFPTIPAAQVNSDWNAASGVAEILNKPTIPDDLNDMTDVDITTPADGDYLVYNGTTEKWENTGSAPTPTYTDITITLYSAVEDLVSFTDAAGISHTEQFATNQSSKSITFKINPSGSTSITFTSSVAKNPDSLSDAYSKQVSISSGTTSVYFMPNDNVLYWWGYQGTNFEVISSANGWTAPAGYSLGTPTLNVNNIAMSAGNNQQTGIGSKITISTNAYCIAEGVTVSSGTYAFFNTRSGKDLSLNAIENQNLTASTITKMALSNTTANYLALYTGNGRAFRTYAMWYE